MDTPPNGFNDYGVQPRGLPKRPNTPLPGRTRSTQRFKGSDVRILKSWYSTHLDHPYPTSQDVRFFQEQTKLEEDQIRNWFANKRRREKVSSTTSPPQEIQTYSVAAPIAIADTNDLDSFTPFDRWRASPPENDPVDLSALMEAATSSPIDPLFTDYNFQSDFSDKSDMSLSMFQVPSVSSSWGYWSGSEASLAASHDSTPPSDVAQKPISRRKRKARKPSTFQSLGKKTVHCFQCTFCTRTFKTKYDWQRHEKSIHLNFETWVCCFTTITHTVVDCDNSTLCVHCDALQPSARHIAEHDFSQCMDVHSDKRASFKRKDHLVQHLKLVHNSKFTPEMLKWNMSIEDNLTSTCGFCFAKLLSWGQRVEHLAEHFRAGIGMESWIGSWGFEPHIAAVVEHAMPPYLLHFERSTSYPFVAINKATREHCEVDYSGDGSSEMELTLASQITERVGRGEDFPTDEEIGIMARMIVYGNTDPVDITLADFPDWLAGFKQRRGFPEPSPESILT